LEDLAISRTHGPKAGLLDPLVLTNHFTLAGDRIASLIIVGNKPGY
jgi:hypothetical protein